MSAKNNAPSPPPSPIPAAKVPKLTENGTQNSDEKYRMRYDSFFCPPDSPPVVKYAFPPVPGAPNTPEGNHYIFPSNSDEMCACALRKSTDVHTMEDEFKILKDWREYTEIKVADICERIESLEKEQDQAIALTNMYDHLLMIMKDKKHWVQEEALEAQSIVVPPLRINLDGAQPSNKKKVELIAQYQSLYCQKYHLMKNQFKSEEEKQRWLTAEEKI